MKLLYRIFSALYALVLHVRHWLYDAGVFRKEKFDIPVVCVGNLTVGGTGKTPVTEYLVRMLGKSRKVAVLSRGYGRKTRGYLVVEPTLSFLKTGDEPKQIKRKFPDVPVVVCENRAEGIRRIVREFPDVDMIVMDDGFQHRSVEAKVNIVLMDYTRPVYEDKLLPEGRLRDLPSQLYRADIIVVTKCPEYLSPIERRIIFKSLKIYPYQSLYFTRMLRDRLTPVFPEDAGTDNVASGCNVMALAGVGNPGPFTEMLGHSFHVVDTLLFPDHHIYRMRDLRKIVARLARLPEDTIVVTTEKDGVKLTNRHKIPETIRRRLYVIPLRLVFPDGDEDKFLKNILQYVGKD